MSNDIDLAFEHPEARARETATTPLDRISVRDHVITVEIGAFQAERGTTQRISFNVVVEVVPLTGPACDDVDRILSYDRVTEAIAAALAVERLNLLETLAERVATLILVAPQAARVFVRIEKLDRGPAALGVEIVRSRTDAPAAAMPGDTPHPRVVYVANAAMGRGLAARLDGWAADGAPLILCVGLPDGGAPQAAARLVQRRIDLLAQEQNAWMLAGQDARCIVTATRTELDWAMRAGQISVWAPSKIILDAPGGAGPDTVDPLSQIVWFAGQMQARELVVAGGVAPDVAGLSVRAEGLE